MSCFAIPLLSLLLLVLHAPFKGIASLSATISHHNEASLTSMGVITTVAGSKIFEEGDTTDGITATSARLDYPRGIALDKERNIYIADSRHSKIQKVTASTGIITTVAETGASSYSGDGGQATLATLNDPSGVCLDTSGNVFIADRDNGCIRKVTVTTGIITTVAGNGYKGSTKSNVAATSTSLNGPQDVVVDSSGNIFISDRDNRQIHKITASTGIIMTIAGSGQKDYQKEGSPRTSDVATEYNFGDPVGIVLDSLGNIYIAGGFIDPCVFKLTVGTGKISVVAGTGPLWVGEKGYNGDNILATKAQLIAPFSVAFDTSGDMHITDFSNNRIRKVTTSTGMITTVAGRGKKHHDFFSVDVGNATSVDIHYPSGIAIDIVGNIYYSCLKPDYVRKITYPEVTSSSSFPSKSSPATFITIVLYLTMICIFLCFCLSKVVEMHRLQKRFQTGWRELPCVC